MPLSPAPSTRHRPPLLCSALTAILLLMLALWIWSNHHLLHVQLHVLERTFTAESWNGAILLSSQHRSADASPSQNLRPVQVIPTDELDPALVADITANTPATPLYHWRSHTSPAGGGSLGVRVRYWLLPTAAAALLALAHYRRRRTQRPAFPLLFNSLTHQKQT